MIMTKVKVAVGLPVYNGQQWLRASVESILGQTFSDLVLVISDNASTDRTQGICEEFQAKDSRVQYFRNSENVGVFRNFDLAFRRTSAKYFKWCAVGDVCDPSFIEKAVAILDESDDVVLVHSKTRLIGIGPEHPERYMVELNLVDDEPAARFRKYLTVLRLNNVMNGLIRSEQLGQTSLNKVFHASDKCMIAELALRGKFIEIPEELFFRRMQADTATALKSPEQTKEFFAAEPNSPAILSNWKTELALMKGVLKAPIILSQKVSLLFYVTKRMIWARETLLRELVHYFRSKGASE